MAEYIDREAFKKSVEDDFCSYGERKNGGDNNGESVD